MSNKVKNFRLIIILFICFFAGYLLGTYKIATDWKNYKPQITIASKEPPTDAINVDFGPFWIVWQKLQTEYYDKSKLDSQKMVNGAIAGMIDTLGDPFTVYLPPVQNTSFKQGLAGQFTGIGAELGAKGKSVVVIAPISGSPAEKSGIKAGDTIVKVDGTSTSGWNLQQTVEKIRGPKGTKVKLTIIHKDTEKEIDVTITRDVITVKSVEGWVKKVTDVDSIKIKNSDLAKMLEEQNLKEAEVAYIRLSQFGDSTNKDWRALVNELNLKIIENNNFKGVILDLRNNPGGYLTDAVFIASEFLPEGSTVVTEEKNGTIIERLTVQNSADRPKGSFIEKRVVILVNKGSASASEIVAGALRDIRNGENIKIVGETTFGKGTIQTAEDLGNGSGLHVTIAKWLTPSGTWVNGTGLKPDIEVKLDSKDPSRDTQLEKAIEELLK
jgi:carboxyl-terminal processing protease